MTKLRKVKKSLTEFAGREVKSTEDLLTAIREARKREETIESDSIKVIVNGLCELSINVGYYYSRATVNIHKKNHIEMSDIINKTVPLLQKEHNSQEFPNSMIISLRHGVHAAQIISGHLEKSGDVMLPMHEVPSARDQTMIRTLRTLKDSSVDNTIKALGSSSNLREHDITVGLFGYAKDFLYNGGTREKVAKTLKFNVVSKPSEGIVLNGKDNEEQVCTAIRSCVHSEEINPNEVANEVAKTYTMMKSLEKDPSIVMGLGELEIHADSKSISIENNSKDQELFSKLLDKLLKSAEVKDLSAATIQYKRETGKSLLRKWAGAWTERAIDSAVGFLENFADGCKNYLARNETKISASLILAGIPLIFVYLLTIGQSLFQSAIEVLPAIIAVAFCALISEENGWMKRIGNKVHLFFFYAIVLMSILIASASFDFYILLLKIAAIIAVSCTLIKFVGKEREKKINNWIISLSDKAIENRTVMTILTILGIVLGVVTLAMSGILMLPAIVLAVLVILLATFLDRKFWREVKRDRQRQADRFFADFRKKRPDMPEKCEIRFEITKCRKLRNPFRGIPTKLAKYLKNKFPEILTLSGAKKTSFNLVSGKWVNGVIDFLR